jgi:hypothetical protein
VQFRKLLILFGGASRDRTDDLIVANDALSLDVTLCNHEHKNESAAFGSLFLRR